jgi:hypothetical protein
MYYKISVTHQLCQPASLQACPLVCGRIIKKCYQKEHSDDRLMVVGGLCDMASPGISPPVREDP